MDFFIGVDDISKTQLWLYNIFLILYFVYLLHKFTKYDVAKYFISLFTVGIAYDVGSLLSLGNSAMHAYLIVMSVWGVFLLHKYGFRGRKEILILFLIFVFYFILFSRVFHNDNIPLIISKVFRYIVPVIAFFVAESYVKASKGRGIVLYHKVINDIVLAQIIFCVVKLLILQSTQEGLVGSLSGVHGGGAGTSFPLLSLLWLGYVTKMKFSKKFLLYIIGLLFIGFMTGKRAIWLLFPIEYFVLYLYYKGKDFSQILKYTAPAILVVLLFLYFGLRLSPTLNPDNKVWGRFDIEYAYDYAIKYSGGSETAAQGMEVKEGDGRLGAVLLFWNDIVEISNYKKEILIGYGNEELGLVDAESYNNRDANFGISYRGAMTAIVMLYFTVGIIGLVLFLIYFLSIFSLSWRENYVVIILCITLFDFIFYNGQIVRNVPMQSLLLTMLVILRVKPIKLSIK